MLSRAGPILAIALILAPAQALAGAWTLDANTGQIIVTATPSQATQAFDGSRNIESTPRYTKFELQALLEYGLTDRFTFMLAPGFQHIDVAAPDSGSRTGQGYTDIGGRYQFIKGNDWVFSGQMELRAPGTNQTANPAAIGYTDPELDMRALFGKSFTVNGLASFIDLEIAQRFRFGDPPSEFRFDATFGIRTSPKWQFLLQSFNVISEGSGSSDLWTSYDYSKLQLSAVYSLTPALSIQVGAFTTFSGRNALQENGLVTALSYKF
jgi:hypothetical protein